MEKLLIKALQRLYLQQEKRFQGQSNQQRNAGQDGRYTTPQIAFSEQPDDPYKAQPHCWNQPQREKNADVRSEARSNALPIGRKRQLEPVSRRVPPGSRCRLGNCHDAFSYGVATRSVGSRIRHREPGQEEINAESQPGQQYNLPGQPYVSPEEKSVEAATGG